MVHSIKRIKIAVSSCLLGEPVRYDGNNKDNQTVRALCEIFECVSICPECLIGLGVPRPPIHILKISERFHAQGKANPGLDVTQSLETLATEVAKKNNSICGYVLKARSPSCGIDSTPWRNESTKENGTTSGIYSAKIQKLMPTLPFIEETDLENPTKMEEFVEKVKGHVAQL